MEANKNKISEHLLRPIDTNKKTVRFNKDEFGNYQCECGCGKYYSMNNMDIFNDMLISDYCETRLYKEAFDEYKKNKDQAENQYDYL